jgi:hypothetical protein
MVLSMAMPGRIRWALRTSLAAVGLAVWLTAGGGVAQWHRQLPLVVALVLAVVIVIIPRSRRLIESLIAHAAHPTPTRRAQTAVAVALVASLYLGFTAHRQGRYLRPHWHDELSYAVQARMLASGHLSMPPHPMRDFFETYYLITSDRAYASIYTPGAAAFHVPAVWLGLPPWLTPVLLAGAVMGLLYRVIAELLDGAAGLLGALMLVSIQNFRMFSTMLMSQPPTMVLTLTMLVCLLRFRRTASLALAVAIGALAGFAAITRPIDAFMHALPIGIAMLLLHRSHVCHWQLAASAGPTGGRRGPGYASGAPLPRRAISVDRHGRTSRPWHTGVVALLAVGSAVPFLLLQLHVNRSITGSALTFPWSLYVDRDMPGTAPGFPSNVASLAPRTTLEQKRLFYDLDLRPRVERHTPANVLREWTGVRLRAFLAGSLPHGVLLTFALPGLLLWRRGRWVLILSTVGLVLAYSTFYVLQEYYPLTAAAGMILLTLAGVRALSVNHAARAGLCTFVAILCLLSLPEANPKSKDQLFDPALIRRVDAWVDEYQGPPAIVLFAFHPGRPLREEPVYNFTTANPDDARVIRAHDLGPARNGDILRYYAARQPDRIVYHFRDDVGFERIGRVGDLVATERPR